MLIKAEQRNSRQSPRKVRLVANAIRKLSIPKAIDQLALMEQKGSLVVLKVLKQAVSNATNNHGLNMNDLTIHEVTVNEGPSYKRFRAVSRGRAHTIIKQTCHVRITLESKVTEVAQTPAQEVKQEKVTKTQPTEKKMAKKTVKKAEGAVEKKASTPKPKAKKADK